jgi:hypothetical protein
LQQVLLPPGPMQGAPNVDALHVCVQHFVPLVAHEVPGGQSATGSE